MLNLQLTRPQESTAAARARRRSALPGLRHAIGPTAAATVARAATHAAAAAAGIGPVRPGLMGHRGDSQTSSQSDT